MNDELYLRWLNRDLRDQLVSSMDTLKLLRERCDQLKIKMVHHLDEGQGLTQIELIEIYAEFERLFPRRVRKPPDSLDVPL